MLKYYSGKSETNPYEELELSIKKYLPITGINGVIIIFLSDCQKKEFASVATVFAK